MGKLITIAIIGLGNRGKDVYAPLSKRFPDKMKIVAAADIDPDRLTQAAEQYSIPENACYQSAEKLLEEDRLSDAIIIATQDRQHVKYAVPALKKGYDILMEKPISPDLEECREIAETAEKYGRKVVICHVLRYTPVFRKVKQLIDAGKIGDIVSVMAIENVGWFHQAHSFVRGNWSNADKSSPMILQKCCHDFDIYLWLSEKKCQSVSSFGSTYLFKEERAPKGSTKTCFDGCKVKDTCIFDAEKIYLDNKLIGCRQGNSGWPLDVITQKEKTEENLLKALKKSEYGRCVYRCDNNVVDNQVVNLLMTDGTTMSLTMSGFTSAISRYAKIMGTKGELYVNLDIHRLEENEIRIRKFDPQITEEIIDIKSLSDDFSGHGGGEAKLIEDFLDLLSGEIKDTAYVTSLDRSLESHYCALAAELSRAGEGKVVHLNELRETE